MPARSHHRFLQGQQRACDVMPPAFAQYLRQGGLLRLRSNVVRLSPLKLNLKLSSPAVFGRKRVKSCIRGWPARREFPQSRPADGASPIGGLRSSAFALTHSETSSSKVRFRPQSGHAAEQSREWRCCVSRHIFSSSTSQRSGCPRQFGRDEARKSQDESVRSGHSILRL